MSAATHPWTFVHAACGQPAVHAAAIPRLSDRVGNAPNFEHVDGSRVRETDAMVCDSCRRSLFDRLTLASMTVEANWRRREST